MPETIVLPTSARAVKSLSPGTLLIYGAPKSGKTTITSQLKNSLVLELEPKGADFVAGTILEIDKPSQLQEAFEAISKAGNPYKYIIIDTITQLDMWSEIIGTYNYMNKSQGKKFNREGEQPNGKMIMHTDSRFETVHELPNGAGYQHSRNQMVDWYNQITKLAPHTILIAHIKDKLIESKIGDSVEAIDIALTGKVKTVYASRVDAIGYFTRKGKQGILNFDNEHKAICGGRCSHLNGEIVISEKQADGSIKTFWDKIYID